VGDVFRISNTFVAPYGATIYSGAPPIEFVGSGKSELEVDAFLGGPGSTADNLIIDGNVSGKTKVDVNNTNAGPGVLNKQGIPVVYVNGATPKGNEFFLSQPIDTGFFNYDLFFRPTGSGVFELRSFLGPGRLRAAAAHHRGPGPVALGFLHLVRPHRRFEGASERRRRPCRDARRQVPGAANARHHPCGVGAIGSTATTQRASRLMAGTTITI